MRGQKNLIQKIAELTASKVIDRQKNILQIQKQKTNPHLTVSLNLHKGKMQVREPMNLPNQQQRTLKKPDTAAEAAKSLDHQKPTQAETNLLHMASPNLPKEKMPELHRKNSTNQIGRAHV